MKLGKISLLLDCMNAAKNYFKEAANILLITHGKGHPLVKEELNAHMLQCF